MWEILLNSILNGWLKWAVLLTNYKWAVVNFIRIKKRDVLLTNCKWAVVNSIRIKKMGCTFLQIANGLYVLCQIRAVGLLS